MLQRRERPQTSQDVIRENYNKELAEKAAAARVAVLEQYFFNPSNEKFQDFFIVLLEESNKVAVRQEEDTQLIADLKHLRGKLAQEAESPIVDLKVSFITTIIQFLRKHVSHQVENKLTAVRAKDSARAAISSVLIDQLKLVKADTDGVVRRIENREDPFPIAGRFVSIKKRISDLNVFLAKLYDSADRITYQLSGHLPHNPKVILDFVESFISEVHKRGLEETLEVLAMQRNFLLSAVENDRKQKQAGAEPSSESPDPNSQSSLHDQEKSEQHLDS